MEDAALALRLSIPELAAIFERAERDIRDGFALVARAQDALNDAFDRTEVRGIRVQDKWQKVRWEDPDAALREVRREVWSVLLERLELRRFMSVAAWNELQQQLKGDDVPEVNAETIAQMATQFRARMKQMLEGAVIEVFEWLRPRNDRYKTNSQLEIGPRVCLSYVLEGRDYTSRWRVDYRYQPQLTALENVFTALDGKGAVTKTHYSELSNAISACASEKCHGETEYFEFRGYRNRSLHLRFKRLDLLARFNQIAGGARLKPRR